MARSTESSGNASPKISEQTSATLAGAARPEKRFATVTGSPERAAVKMDYATRARSVGVETFSTVERPESMGRSVTGRPSRQPVAGAGKLTSCGGQSWRTGFNASAKRRPNTASARASSIGQRRLAIGLSRASAAWFFVSFRMRSTALLWFFLWLGAGGRGGGGGGGGVVTSCAIHSEHLPHCLNSSAVPRFPLLLCFSWVWGGGGEGRVGHGLCHALLPFTVTIFHRLVDWLTFPALVYCLQAERILKS